MSQSLTPKLADDRSTSKSADSHTISGPNELGNVSQEAAHPLVADQPTSHTLASGPKTEAFPSTVHAVQSAEPGTQANAQRHSETQGAPYTSTAQTIGQPHAHAHTAGQGSAPQPQPPGSLGASQALPLGGHLGPPQPNGIVQQGQRTLDGQLGQLPKPSIPSHLQNRVAAGNQAHLGGLQNKGSGLSPQHGQSLHTAGGQAMPTQPNGMKSGKTVSINDIQRVQNYIEKCLQLYLSQKEVVQQLEQQCQIEPCFTQLVWQKLEEQNQEFFRAYYTRLKLKDQIVLFNHLLDEQVKMLSRMPRPASGHALPTSNAMMQPVVSAPNQYPQQRLGAPAQVASSLPLPTNQAIPAAFAADHTANQQEAQSASSQPTAMGDPEFPSMGLEAGTSDHPHDLSHGHGLHFSESELNLAGMDGLGKGLMGVNDHDLANIPRNFSLTDLGLDTDQGGLPRNISFPDFPALDLDSGGEHG